VIDKLSIRRFKSVRSLDLQCRKVNVIIGEPDTGKTNILEALYFLSRLGWNLPIDSSLRLSAEPGFDQLFYRQFFDAPIEIRMHLVPPHPESAAEEITLTASIQGAEGALNVQCAPLGPGGVVRFGHQFHVPPLDWIRFYAFTSSQQWGYSTGFPHGTTLVNPPHGYNLMYIARHNQRVYEFLRDTVAGLNWKLKFDPKLKTFGFSEVRPDEIVDYSLDLLSDSLKRFFFYSAILLTSERATLVLDEPDVFAFPPYPKNLGEMIAGDESNQFFLTTHNPYFLAGIVEKTPVDQLAVFVAYRDSEGATALKLLSPDENARIIEQGANVFFQLDEFVGP